MPPHKTKVLTVMIHSLSVFPGCRSLTRVLTRSVCLRIEQGKSSNTNWQSPSPTQRDSAWSDHTITTTIFIPYTLQHALRQTLQFKPLSIIWWQLNMVFTQNRFINSYSARVDEFFAQGTYIWSKVPVIMVGLDDRWRELKQKDAKWISINGCIWHFFC